MFILYISYIIRYLFFYMDKGSGKKVVGSLRGVGEGELGPKWSDHLKKKF